MFDSIDLRTYSIISKHTWRGLHGGLGWVGFGLKLSTGLSVFNSTVSRTGGWVELNLG